MGFKYFVLDSYAVAPGFHANGKVHDGFNDLESARKRAKDDTLMYQRDHVIYKAYEVCKLHIEPVEFKRME